MADDDFDALLLGVILTDEGRQNPYPAYAELRSRAPRHRTSFGGLVVTRYADCMELLRNPRFGRPLDDMDAPTTLRGRRPLPLADSGSMLFKNPPDHTRLRGLVSRAFTPKRVEALRPQIKSLLAPVLAEMQDAVTVDVMEVLASSIPVSVISALLGVPESESGRFRGLVRDVTSFIDAAADDAALARAAESAMELGGYFAELVVHLRQHPDDGLLSAMIQVEAEGDRLSEGELLSNAILLYAAGFETTSNLIGNGLRALLLNPDEMSRLRDEPELMPSAIWEMLRWDSPVQLNGRTALEDTRALDIDFARGDSTVILQGAGNWDPEVFAGPERFDIARFVSESTPPPLSFGWGVHHCLGAHLARAEGEVVFEELLGRFSKIELAADELHYRPSFTLRGLDSLVVSVA